LRVHSFVAQFGLMQHKLFMVCLTSQDIYHASEVYHVRLPHYHLTIWQP
jgi:hypothetical protein